MCEIIKRQPYHVLARCITLFTLVISAISAANVNSQATTWLPDKPYYITILHTNDHHGRFWQNAIGEYGLSAQKTVVDEIRKEVAAKGGELLLLSGGDINTGVPESDTLNAEPDFKGMNKIGYDAMAVGNHEFDHQLSIIREQQKWVDFPFLSANIYFTQSNERVFSPYTVFNKQGIKIAVLGLTTDDTIFLAIISDMSQPLGFAIGNALEVKEAIDTLKGKGPADLTELVLTLGSQMVVLAGKATTLDEARAKLQDVIANGKALEKLKVLINAQGGDSSIVDNPEKLAKAPYQIELPAKQSGYVAKIIADKVGIIAMQLGAGRATKDDVIDPAVGIVLHKKIGDRVSEGESLLTIHANTSQLEGIKQKLYEYIKIATSANAPTLIHKVITQ